MSVMKKVTASVFGSLLILGAVATPSQAQPVDQDGLVNVNVGDVTLLENVNVAVAANLAAQVCGVDVGPVALAVLGQAVNVVRSGDTETICTIGDQAVTISQDIED